MGISSVKQRQKCPISLEEEWLSSADPKPFSKKEGRKEKKTDEEQSRRERRERTRSEGEKERLWRNGEMVNLIEKESNGNNSL